MSNKRSKKQEQKIASDVNGRESPASGALPFWDHDVKSAFWLVEAKYTDAKSFSLKRAYINDFVITAFKNGKLPAMIIEFAPKEKYAVIRYEDWLAYNQMLEEGLDRIVKDKW